MRKCAATNRSLPTWWRRSALDALAGVAINPPTPLEKIDRVAPECDLILCMSVMPGFGGQQFDAVALEKLRTLRDRDDVTALLEVDGGVNHDTIANCVAPALTCWWLARRFQAAKAISGDSPNSNN